jgi:glycine zipper 2TM protein
MNAKTIRNLSVTGIVASLLIAASPVWAHDGYYGHHYGYGPWHVYPYRPAVVVVPPTVRYRYAAAPVYYAPQPAYVPAPTYYGPPAVAYAPLGAIGGAVAGAAIGSGLGHGNGRTAAIAIGSVVGAVIGQELTGGR